MKKLLLGIVCILLIFFIYIFTKNDKITYFSISDQNNNMIDKKVIKYLDNKNILDNYVIYQNSTNYRVIDLINDINDNKKIVYKNKEYTINNLLVKSELIILNIGHNDLIYCNLKNEDMYKYINEFVDDLDNLFLLIRDITKEKIILVFDYDLDEEYYEYLHERMKFKLDKYNVIITKKNEIMKYI